MEEERVAPLPDAEVVGWLPRVPAGYLETPTESAY